ncbi:hypothetical protein BJ741DRAFT_692483 [Chytriomyces cf. hyalinus JEL632]|nr:hypothetical protein BJ741DRAFT_692483 [Chytriomyces cf. hyalinus JEL632]
MSAPMQTEYSRTFNGNSKTRVSLSSLPCEVLTLILLHLPIDSHLQNAALSFRGFARILVENMHFARTHVTTNIHADPGGFTAFKTRTTPVLRKLPLTYLTSIFQHLLENKINTNQLTYPWGPFNGYFMTENAFNTIAAILSKSLSKDGLSRLLDCMRCMRNSRNAAISILKDHQNVQVSWIAMLGAVKRGWTEFVRIYADRGFDVSQNNYGLFAEARQRLDADMTVNLLRDSRIDLSVNGDFLLTGHLHRSTVTEELVNFTNALLSDRRVPYGSFLKAIVQGDMECMAEHLAMSAFDLASVEHLSIKFAVYCNQPRALKSLLQDSRISPYSLKNCFLLEAAVAKEYLDVYYELLTNTQMDLNFQEKAILEFCAMDNIKAIRAFMSCDQVKLATDAEFWNTLLIKACANGSFKVVQHILAIQDSGIDVNQENMELYSVIHNVLEECKPRTINILYMLGADIRFNPFDAEDEMESFLDSGTEFTASPFAKLLRTDPRFFATDFVWRLADTAFENGNKGVIRMLLFVPGLESHAFHQLHVLIELFDLDPEMSLEDALHSLLHYQTLCEAVHSNEAIQTALLLRKGSDLLQPNQIMELFADAAKYRTVETWTAILNHVLSTETLSSAFQDEYPSLTECFGILSALVEFPVDLPSFDKVSKLYSWCRGHTYFSILNFMVEGPIQKICKSRSLYYAALDYKNGKQELDMTIHWLDSFYSSHWYALQNYPEEE